MTTATTERRAAPRYPAQANFYVLMVRAGAAARTCRVANLSRVGALLKQPTEGSAVPEASSDVVLRFAGSSSHRYHSVLARVERIDEDGIGLKFVEPLNDEVANLCQFALGKRMVEHNEGPSPLESEAMQMDLDESAPRLTVPRPDDDEHTYEPDPAEDMSDEDLDERLSRASNRGLTAVLIGLVAVAALAAFVAVRNFQISDEVSRLEDRMLALGTAPAQAPSAEIAQLDSRIMQLQQEVTALRQNAEQANTAAPAAAGADIVRLREDVAALKKQVAALAAASQAPVRKEIAAPSAAASGWVVQVAAVADRKEAEDLAARIKRAGFATEIEVANVKGKTYYRVVAVGFSGQEQARGAAVRIKQELKLTETPWVSKR